MLRRFVETGRASVQDFSQRHALEAIAVEPGMRVLDMCAAPGGKSAALADQGALVVACDSNWSRLRKVKHVFTDRVQFPLVVMDGATPAVQPGSFDAVLVDAP